MGGMRWVTKAKCACTSACVDTEYVCVRMDRTLPVPDPPPTRDGAVLEAYEEGTPPPPQTLPWREMDDFKSWGGYPLDPPFT